MIRCRMIGRSAPALLLFLGAGCAEPAPAGPQAARAPDASPEFFAAAVRYMESQASVPVRVDPRPLRPESRLNSVSEGDLLPDAAEAIRLRTAVAEREGWQLTNAVADWDCVFAEGLPPARPVELSDSIRRHREACREGGQRESLVFGLPQAGTDPEHPQRWSIRSMRMLLYGFEVVDLYLEPRPNGAWEVVEKRVRSGVFS